jgi:predicted flap endonuclease-1-like 5' DNA nuclease
MKCTQRLYRTKDRKALVPAGHKNAATLYAVPGDEIPQSAADRFKLIDGALKGAKEDKSGLDKEKKGGAGKGGGAGDSQGDGRAAPRQDNLADLRGVGEKTATALAAAGYTSFASIAAIDPASPPKVDGLPAVFKWAEVVADARAKAPAGTAEQAGASGGAGA